MDGGSQPGSRLAAGAVLAIALVVTGCTAAEPSPIVVYVTPTPPPPTPIVIYVTPTPPPSATPTVTPTTATPSPSLTAPPTAAPGAACTGSADNKAFFAEAASKLPFGVYCAVLPYGWWLSEGSYTQPNGGYLYATYANGSGGMVTIQEGAWCTAGPVACDGGAAVGGASFGGLAGELLQAGATYAVVVDLGTTHAYAFLGNGLTSAETVSLAAAVVRVSSS